MTNFEEKLSRLEELSDTIKKSDISLEDALKVFEEGTKLAKSMEKYLDEMEGKVQILLNNSEITEEIDSEKKATTSKKNSKTEIGEPALGLFDESTEITGTRA